MNFRDDKAGYKCDKVTCALFGWLFPPHLWHREGASGQILFFCCCCCLLVLFLLPVYVLTHKPFTYLFIYSLKQQSEKIETPSRHRKSQRHCLHQGSPRTTPAYLCSGLTVLMLQDRLDSSNRNHMVQEAI